MRVLFLNQYFPPDPAPTGILFREIADDLEQAGHTVDFVDAGQDYRGGQQKGGRMRRELGALRRMLQVGKARPRADVVVSGTSPPCLAVIGDRVARKHRARHFHWAMDVYPEIATALGEIRPGSWVARLTGWMIGRAYRRCAGVVALDEDMSAVLGKYRVSPVVIRPWVFGPLVAQPTVEVAADEPWTWIYSGNLGRAHEWETLLAAQQRLEQAGAGIRLRFQGGGPARAAAQAKAAELGLRNVEWCDYVPEEQLRAALLRGQVLVATQKPEVQGLLWPSKLAMMRALPRGILFVGPTEGAIARELRTMPHAGIFAPGDAEGVAHWLRQRQIGGPMGLPANPAEERRAALLAWRRLIEAAPAKG